MRFRPIVKIAKSRAPLRFFKRAAEEITSDPPATSQRVRSLGARTDPLPDVPFRLCRMLRAGPRARDELAGPGPRSEQAELDQNYLLHGHTSRLWCLVRQYTLLLSFRIAHSNGLISITNCWRHFAVLLDRMPSSPAAPLPLRWELKRKLARRETSACLKT